VAADAELVILDLRDHLDRTERMESTAHLALTDRPAMMPDQERPPPELNRAKNALPLPLAHPAALDPRDQPALPDPLEMMPLVAELVLLALLVLLDQQVQLAKPDQRDLPALPEKSLNQLEPPDPTAVLVLQALLVQMEHQVLQANLAPLAQLVHLAMLELVLQMARMVHLAPRDQQAQQAAEAAATTVHRHARHLATKPRHLVIYQLTMSILSYTSTTLLLV